MQSNYDEYIREQSSLLAWYKMEAVPGATTLVNLQGDTGRDLSTNGTDFDYQQLTRAPGARGPSMKWRGAGHGWAYGFDAWSGGDRTFIAWMRIPSGTSGVIFASAFDTPRPILNYDTNGTVLWYSHSSNASVSWTSALPFDRDFCLIFTMTVGGYNSELFVDGISKGTNGSSGSATPAAGLSIGTDQQSAISSAWFDEVVILTMVVPPGVPAIINSLGRSQRRKRIGRSRLRVA